MMQPWFPDAKLGLFIHWGIYAVKGIPESWSFFRGLISYDDYMKQLDGFTGEKYDPEAWADLFARTGAKYAVLTTKHHDGVALWPTRQGDLSTSDRTPSKELSPVGPDLIGPYAEALRRRDLKVGLYFSHLDWSHPDYASVLPKRFREKTVTDPDELERGRSRFAYPQGVPEDYEKWERFLTFHRAQLKELCQQYRPDLLWFDGDWERDADQWRFAELREQLHAWSPGVILNSRMRGHGDYKTPEQAVPVQRPEGPWEFCCTINDSWGYQPQDHNHKSVRQIVRLLTECVGMGGNLLLDVGPRPDGTIQPEHVDRLEGLATWTNRHAEAIWGTNAGLPHGHFYGPTTLSADKIILYLFCLDRPYESVAVKGIRNKVLAAGVVGRHERGVSALTTRKIGGAPWMNLPGVLYVNVPEQELNTECTVIRVELDGPLDLYSGEGAAVEAN